MAHDPRLSVAAANAAADGMAALFSGGYLRLYTGTKPADASVAVTTQALVVEHRFSDPAFLPAAGGSADDNGIANVAAVGSTDPITWFRCLKSDGTTVLLDGTVGLTGGGAADLKIDAVVLGAGVTSRIGKFTLTEVM